MSRPQPAGDPPRRETEAKESRRLFSLQRAVKPSEAMFGVGAHHGPFMTHPQERAGAARSLPRVPDKRRHSGPRFARPEHRLRRSVDPGPRFFLGATKPGPPALRRARAHAKLR